MGSINSPLGGPVPVSTFQDRKSVASIILPSLGIPYRADKVDPFPAGAISISAMTVAEEKMLAQKGVDPARKTSVLISRVCDLGGFKPEGFLVADTFYLLMKIRSLSYGSNYTFGFRCDDCGHQWTPTVNLETDMDIKVVEEGWQEPFTVELPQSKSVVQYRLLRTFDEIELNTRKTKRGDMEDPTFVSMLARCIMSIDGEQINNPRRVEGWLEKQSVMDRAVLTEDIKENSPGYTADVVLECPSCGFIHEAALPMTAEFFRSNVSARALRGSAPEGI